MDNLLMFFMSLRVMLQVPTIDQTAPRARRVEYGSAYGLVQCTTDKTASPTSTASLAAYIKSFFAIANTTRSTLKIRATHRYIQDTVDGALFDLILLQHRTPQCLHMDRLAHGVSSENCLPVCLLLQTLLACLIISSANNRQLSEWQSSSTKESVDMTYTIEHDTFLPGYTKANMSLSVAVLFIVQLASLVLKQPQTQCIPGGDP